MITRRFIRTRVLQSVYAFKISKKSIEGEEKELLSSLDEMNKFYILMLSFMVKLKEISKFILEDNNKKHQNNFLKNLSNSKVLEIIQSNQDYISFLEKNKLEKFWEKNNQNYINIVLKELKKKDYAITDSIDKEVEFLSDIYTDIISDNSVFHDFFETQNIYWSDDIQVINSLILSTFENIDLILKENKLLSIFKNKDDRDFLINLFLETVRNYDEVDDQIMEFSKNWKKDRISKIDMSILEMGITEFNLYKESIPSRIILNEYIEISKEFSSEKSYIFVNGILDKYFKKN